MFVLVRKSHNFSCFHACDTYCHSLEDFESKFGKMFGFEVSQDVLNCCRILHLMGSCLESIDTHMITFPKVIRCISITHPLSRFNVM